MTGEKTTKTTNNKDSFKIIDKKLKKYFANVQPDNKDNTGLRNKPLSNK